MANHPYYLWQILHNKYFCLMVWLENMILHNVFTAVIVRINEMKSIILWLSLKRKHYPKYIISKTKSTTKIFLLHSGLKTWFQADCCHSKYQMLKGYLCYKTIFCHKVALDAQLISLFEVKIMFHSPNILISVFVKYTDVISK